MNAVPDPNKELTGAELDKLADEAIGLRPKMAGDNIHAAVQVVVVRRYKQWVQGLFPVYTAVLKHTLARMPKASEPEKATEQKKEVSAPPSPARRRELSYCGHASAAMERSEEEAYENFNHNRLPTSTETPPSTTQATQHTQGQLELF